MTRVLVCGGRDFTNWDYLKTHLDELHAEHYFRTLIHGCAAGADLLAAHWAAMTNVPVLRFPALWDDITVPGAVVRNNKRGRPYNKAAGMQRNQRMLDQGNPNFYVVFSTGGPGTRDMVRRCKLAGIDGVEFGYCGH